MRIAFVNHHRRRVGGAEAYLDSVISAFARAGHEVACMYEVDPRSSPRERITAPDDTPIWCVDAVGRQHAVAQFKDWHPDVCFSHGLADTELETEIVSLGRGVLFLHNYYGMCISGNRMHNSAVPRVCDHKFGAKCLLRYLPDHCGGRNPVTMFRMYGVQAKRLKLMSRYRALVANSEFISRELARHNLTSHRVYYPLVPPSDANQHAKSLGPELRLIVAGRISYLKGGHFLIAALSDVQRRLQKTLHVTFAGDGNERAAWERMADSIRTDRIKIAFPGWLCASELKQALCSSHLLVYPSIWPEPFGLSGLEAGFYGVPAVAFSVGGIPEWLHDGVNGHLAPVGISSLGDAIVRCLSDQKHYTDLCAGAYQRAHEYSLKRHLSELMRIFERCAG